MSDEQYDRKDLVDIFYGLTQPNDLSWQDRASCNQLDPELWFPPQGGDGGIARAVCAECPVAQKCFDYAMSNREQWGIWAGTSNRDRRGAWKPGSARRAPRAA